MGLGDLAIRLGGEARNSLGVPRIIYMSGQAVPWTA